MQRAAAASEAQGFRGGRCATIAPRHGLQVRRAAAAPPVPGQGWHAQAGASGADQLAAAARNDGGGLARGARRQCCAAISAAAPQRAGTAAALLNRLLGLTAAGRQDPQGGRRPVLGGADPGDQGASAGRRGGVRVYECACVRESGTGRRGPATSAAAAAATQDQQYPGGGARQCWLAGYVVSLAK